MTDGAFRLMGPFGRPLQRMHGLVCSEDIWRPRTEDESSLAGAGRRHRDGRPLHGRPRGLYRLLDGDYTQGASGDLKAATDQALMMVTTYGIGGTLSSLSAERYQAGGSSGAVDQAVESLLSDALGDARALLAQFRGELEQLVGWLLEDETVAADRLEQLREQAQAQRPAAPAA